MILVGACVGCDASEASESRAAPVPVITGNGVVRGSVKFAGAAPEMQVIATAHCHSGAKPVVDESAVVNDNGTLRNVFVYLEGAPASGGGEAAAPAVLDQVDCRYVPHVLGVRSGQKIRVRSSDPTLHNVHSLASRNRAFNFGMTRAGDERTVAFDRHEFVPVKCDVHPWMTAYVGVFENPWFAATGDDGSFEIAGVPPGSYKLVTWHERYGRLEQAIEVGDQPTEATFEYKREK